MFPYFFQSQTTPKPKVSDHGTFEQEELDFKFDEELVAMGKGKDYKEW